MPLVAAVLILARQPGAIVAVMAIIVLVVSNVVV
jgi:hypothetical protein